MARFELTADREVFALHRQLRAATYRPGRYRLLLLREPKRRLIAAAPVRDRVVHHAVHRVLAPVFDRGLVDTTFACPGGAADRGAAAEPGLRALADSTTARRRLASEPQRRTPAPGCPSRSRRRTPSRSHSARRSRSRSSPPPWADSGVYSVSMGWRPAVRTVPAPEEMPRIAIHAVSPSTARR